MTLPSSAVKKNVIHQVAFSHGINNPYSLPIDPWGRKQRERDRLPIFFPQPSFNWDDMADDFEVYPRLTVSVAGDFNLR